jgi:hypothetical protein
MSAYGCVRLVGIRTEICNPAQLIEHVFGNFGGKPIRDFFVCNREESKFLLTYVI